jgi:hypothetical protein
MKILIGSRTLPSICKSSWYHKNIVKSFNDEVENMAINDRNTYFESFKDCLNVHNVKITDILSGKIVNDHLLSDELRDKLQFALIISWLLISDALHPEEKIFFPQLRSLLRMNISLVLFLRGNRSTFSSDE